VRARTAASSSRFFVLFFLFLPNEHIPALEHYTHWAGARTSGQVHVRVISTSAYRSSLKLLNIVVALVFFHEIEFYRQYRVYYASDRY